MRNSRCFRKPYPLEHTFQNYSDKQLQKVIDGKDYVPDAKKAARNLLSRRKYGELQRRTAHDKSLSRRG